MIKRQIKIISLAICLMLSTGCYPFVLKSSDMDENQNGWQEWQKKVYVFKDRQLNTKIKRVAIVGFNVSARDVGSRVSPSGRFITYFDVSLTPDSVNKLVETASDELTSALAKNGLEVVPPKTFIGHPLYKSMGDEADGYFVAHGLANLYFMGNQYLGWIKNFDTETMGKFMTEFNLDAVIIGNYFYYPSEDEVTPYFVVLTKDGNSNAERTFLFGLATNNLGSGRNRGVAWQNDKNENEFQVLKNLIVSCTRIVGTKMVEKLTAEDSGSIGWQQGE